MAIFKEIQKKMAITTAILQLASIVFKNFSYLFVILQKFLASIVFVVKKLRKILTRRIIRIIRNIRNVLGKVGRFAGPLKFITTVLNNVLGVLLKIIKPFEKALKDLSGQLYEFNQRLSLVKQSTEYRFLVDKLDKIVFKVEEINELAKLLEKQQEWIEKVFPAAFLKQIKGLVDALTTPLKRIKKICTKITDAIAKFTLKVTRYQLIVNNLKSSAEILSQWLHTIEKASNTLRWIIAQLEIVLRKIPFLGYVIDVISFLSGIIDKVIEISGIRSLLEYIVKNNAITTTILNLLNQIIEAVLDLKKDFEAILEDIKALTKDLINLREILRNLHGLLKLIAAFKWFLEFRFPNILEKMREALKKIQNPDFIPLTLSDSNSLEFIVESVNIKGKGIGNDWILHFKIGNEVYDINVVSKNNKEIILNNQIYEETIQRQQKTIQRSIHVSATELDPVYNDFGQMNASKIIKLTNKPQEQEDIVSFSVTATGGDSGGKATITIKLKTILTENENVLLPLSDIGAHNSGINYLEHALNDLRTDMGTIRFAPGLYANMHALDQFLNASELLLNKLKVQIVEASNDTEQQAQLINEFYELIERSQAQIQPERAQDFKAMYFINLKNAIAEENTEEFVTDIAQPEMDDFCSCDDLEVNEFFEPEINTISEEAQNFDIEAYLNSLNKS